MSAFPRCLPLAVVGLLAVLAPAIAGDLTVTIRQGPVYPGDVVRVTVRAPEDAGSIVATWQEREVPLARQSDGTWDGLIGIDIADEGGSRSVQVKALHTNGSATAATLEFVVDHRTLRTRRIRVNPRFVTPPASALARIKEESERLSALFNTTSPGRHWAPDAVRPVEGVAVSGFGVRTIMNGQPGGPHNGLDLAAPTGTPIYAPAAGVVVYARDLYYTGNTVIVDHGQGLYSTMAHMSAMDVREGDAVLKSTLLGKVGATGRVTGPHLHWGMRLHGARVDPLSLIDALATKSSTR
ncbi:MAG: M23 family metallopeptidase [Acidobacteria bacterium]|nr:M23 family metallopeptidase [Acidobacteriota bacterium]